MENLKHPDIEGTMHIKRKECKQFKSVGTGNDSKGINIAQSKKVQEDVEALHPGQEGTRHIKRKVCKQIEIVGIGSDSKRINISEIFRSKQYLGKCEEPQTFMS